MPRCPASELPEAFDLLHGNGQFFQDLPALVDLADARKMKHGVKQHGGVAV